MHSARYGLTVRLFSYIQNRTCSPFSPSHYSKFEHVRNNGSRADVCVAYPTCVKSTVNPKPILHLDEIGSYLKALWTCSRRRSTSTIVPPIGDNVGSIRRSIRFTSDRKIIPVSANYSHTQKLVFTIKQKACTSSQMANAMHHEEIACVFYFRST